MHTTIPHPELVLCIPGPWDDQDELADRIAALDAGYEAFGLVLMESASGYGCDLAVDDEDDPEVTAQFQALGAHWRDTAAMAAIGRHRSVAWLTGYGGTRANAEALMKAATVVLRAGGLGVKVDSTGIAHAPPVWFKLMDNLHLHAAHRALVTFRTDGEPRSCGMHSFGLREGIMDGQGNPADAAMVLKAFTRYLLVESPQVRDGQTFAVDADAPVYVLRAHPGVRYSEFPLLTNPYGAWYLIPRASGGLH